MWNSWHVNTSSINHIEHERIRSSPRLEHRLATSILYCRYLNCLGDVGLQKFAEFSIFPTCYKYRYISEYVYIYSFTYVHIYIHIWTHAHTHTYMCRYIYIYTYKMHFDIQPHILSSILSGINFDRLSDIGFGLAFWRFIWQSVRLTPPENLPNICIYIDR